MCLQMLIRELLEVVKDLFLNDWCQTLHLLYQNTFLHLELAHIQFFSWLLSCSSLTKLVAHITRVIMILNASLGNLKLLGLEVE